MGNGPSSSVGDVLTDISKTDKLLTPSCTLTKDQLKAEWTLFLEMQFLDEENRLKLAKLKPKAYWPLLCKFQRNIAKRLSDDAKISERMDLLYEAAALVQASICIHEKVTNVNIAGTDYADCKRRMKLLEKDVATGRQRIAGQCPDDTTIGLALDEYISCSCLLNCIRADFRILSSVYKWNLCLYFEYMTATNLAQNFADRAVDNLFLPASREFYRCAMHFFQSDALIEALQAVTSEIEYQEFSAKIHNRRLPDPVPSGNLKSVRDQYAEIMSDFPHVIREDMAQVSPESMENIVLFIQTLRLNRADLFQVGNSGFIVQPRPGHKSSVSEILSSLSQTEEDTSLTVEKKVVGEENVPPAKPQLPVVDEQSVSKPKLLAGASSTKTSSKISDLQAQLNLNPAMFMGAQPPKALALKKSKGLVVEDKLEKSQIPDPESEKKPASEQVSNPSGAIKDDGLAHANLERPGVRTRRPRKAVAATFAIADDC